MVIGKSHRIVIEVDLAFKEQMYEVLRLKGMTLKDWFTGQVIRELLDTPKPITANADTKVGDNAI